MSFLDFVCFNTFLEWVDAFELYVARLQNIADGKPLVIGELGLDSRRNGCEQQASVLSAQVRSAFEDASPVHSSSRGRMNGTGVAWK